MRIEVWCITGHDKETKRYIKGKRIRTVYRECIPRVGDSIIIFNGVEEIVIGVLHNLDKDGTKIFIGADMKKYYEEI